MLHGSVSNNRRQKTLNSFSKLMNKESKKKKSISWPTQSQSTVNGFPLCTNMKLLKGSINYILISF